MSSAETVFPDRLSQARSLHQAGRIAEARQLYEEVIGLQPDHVEALNALGVLSGQSRNPQQAIQYFERVLAAQPDDIGAHCNLGLALKQLNQFEAALASFGRALALHADDPIVHYSLAETYREMGRSEEALAAYGIAIALNPSFAQGHFRRGILLQLLGRFAAATASFELTLSLQPDHPDAQLNRAASLAALRRYEEALAGYERLIALRPENPGIRLLRGNVLGNLNRRKEAVAAYDQTIALDEHCHQAHADRGIVLHALGRVEEALASFDRAISIKPDYAYAYCNRAHALRSVKRYDAATADYHRAAQLSPDTEFLPGARLVTSLQTCDWIALEPLLAQITTGIEQGRPVVLPREALGLLDDPSLQLQAARIWVQNAGPAGDGLGPIARRTRGKKLRIGYFSGDFSLHPSAWQLAPLIETHDRSRFEVLGFAAGPDTNDDARQRLVSAFDQFIDVDGRSDRDVALLARRLELDIAIDLGGYTDRGRPGMFALRAAPLQVSHLGYPGTLGAEYMDYVVADRVVVTRDSESHFAEKLVYLPDTFQVNDRERRMADRIFTRAELGLPPVGFVFCCFSRGDKILPATFASWMRILNRVPLSVLYLESGEPALEANLRAYASRHRIDPRRLVFADRMAPAECLARYRAADLFLDTLPYSAGTRASDALWAGLPVLTIAGNSFAARIAASLLAAVGLPELVTTTRESYEESAVSLASHPLRLRQIRSKLLDAPRSSALFDTERFTRNLESAFIAMQDRHDAGLPADHIRL